LEDGSGTLYYLDRLDLSDPATPEWLLPLNIPGQLLAIGEGDDQIVTLDRADIPLSEAACDEYEDYTICYTKGQQLSALQLRDDRAVRTKKVALGAIRDWSQYGVDGDAIYRQHWNQQTDESRVSAFSRGAEELGTLSAEQLGAGRYADLARVGTAVGWTDGSRLGLFDLSGDVVSAGPSGDVTRWCSYWVSLGQTAYCAAQSRGVYAVPLE
jgi:hypothetical protein